MADIKPEQQFAQAQQGGRAAAAAAKDDVAAQQPARPAGPPADPAAEDRPAAGRKPATAAPPGGAENRDDAGDQPAAAGAAWLIADADLYVSNPESGAAPARAFTAGDRVPATLAAQWGWTSQCHVPAWAMPDPDQTPTEPASAGGKEQ